MSGATVVKQVTFPVALLELVQTRVAQLGVSIPEYVRHLVITDTEELVRGMSYVDSETEKSIGRALRDYEAGRVTAVLKTDRDIDDYFDKLDEENEREKKKV